LATVRAHIAERARERLLDHLYQDVGKGRLAVALSGHEILVITNALGVAYASVGEGDSIEKMGVSRDEVRNVMNAMLAMMSGLNKDEVDWSERRT
jgi:hypothetical protein